MSVQQLDGLEWHDGWLASILRTDDGRFYASFAVAVDWNSHRVRYALCQILQVQAETLTENHSNFGFSPEFNEAWRSALTCGPVYLANGEPRAGGSITVVESTRVERELLEAYVLPLVERASSEVARRTWLKHMPS